jgi:ribosomal protein L37AE/L43A
MRLWWRECNFVVGGGALTPRLNQGHVVPGLELSAENGFRAQDPVADQVRESSGARIASWGGFDIERSVDRFREALTERNLCYTDDRRLLLFLFLLQIEKPVTLPVLERAFLKSYRPLGSSEKLRLPARIVQTVRIFVACGLAKEIEPEAPEYCSSCLHGDNITIGAKRWRCWHCGAGGCLQPRFVRTNSVTR